MSFETLHVDRHDGVVTVTLDRPQRKNAASGLLWHELDEVLRLTGRSRDDRVLVLTGAGGDFCSGADLSDPAGMSNDPQDPQLLRMQFVSRVVLALHELGKPTLAKVRGVAAGAGMSLALACDLVVASDTSRFSAIFARRGLSLDAGASWLLPRLVGLHRAKELAFFAELLGADEVARLGLVNKVVPDGELDEICDAWAARLASGPPLALAMTKRLLNDSSGSSFSEALEHESWAQTVNFATDDTREAMAAFLEKREPRFGGR